MMCNMNTSKDEVRRMNELREQAAVRCSEYGAMTRQRDEIVTGAVAAGMEITEVARLTGISRATIYRVLTGTAEGS
jgi:transcriptional regulator of acetoin/glycerol metabolism